jgi:hypothetical protein
MPNPNDSVTPNTVLFVLLLNELNESTEMESNQALSKFVIDKILVISLLKENNSSDSKGMELF